MKDENNIKSVVIDNGSYSVKGGHSNEDIPSFVIPSVVGYAQQNELKNTKTTYVGNEAQMKRDILNIKPIIDGDNINWNEIEILWNHCFYNELQIEPEQQSIFLIKPEFAKENDKEKMAEIMFEKFKFPSMYISVPSILSLHASGLTRGIVVDSGEYETHIVSIHDGYISNRENLKFGGYHLTSYMMKLLEQNNVLTTTTFNTHKNREIAENVKEKLGYIALDYKEAMQTVTLSSSLEKSCKLPDGHVITIGGEIESSETSSSPSPSSSPSLLPPHENSYQLPDGKVVIIDKECFRCPETLFQPILMGTLSDGIHKAIYNSIMKNNIINEIELFNNIVLSGGTTSFPGLSDRLKKELTILAPSEIPKINIITPPQQPQFSPWIGGSMLASQSTKQMWISKKEYDEYGLLIVHAK